MDEHLKLFQYLSQYEDFIKSPDYLDPNVSWVLENDKVYYNYTPINNGDNGQVKPYESEYLTMELLEEGKLTFARLLGKDVMYSTDNGNTWTEIDNGFESITEGDVSNLVYTPTFPAGTKVLWKSNIDKSLIGASPIEGMDMIGVFGSTCNYNLSGNIMSLIYGDNYATNSELIIDGVSLPIPFYGMFGMLNTMIYGEYDGTMSYPGVVDATNLILPAMTLTDSCYSFMFYLCTNLKYAPELPATTLAEGCYQHMFSYCTSLTTAPELPATKLASSCYYGMFANCPSLTTAPALPATTLATYCYRGMFQGCTSLTTVPELPATTLTTYCYSLMFSGCINLTTAPALPATTLADSCYASMFEGCTSLTSAPELPATTLNDICYASMFEGCTSLTTAPALPATTLAQSCYSSIFKGCTSLTTAPALPATTLVYGCYRYMFQGCTNLNDITILAIDISASSCLSDWVSGVASTGTFTKHPDMNSLPTGTSGIPSGWTVVDCHVGSDD